MTSSNLREKRSRNARLVLRVLPFLSQRAKPIGSPERILSLCPEKDVFLFLRFFNPLFFLSNDTIFWSSLILARSPL